jgi:arylsulfatase A-like enzyme
LSRNVRITLAIASILAVGGLPGCGWQDRSGSSEFQAAGDLGREKIIFIVIDALRRDHLGLYGHTRPVSPTIDRLASEGLLLRNLTVHAPQTVPSTLSLLTSKLPAEHGVQYWQKTRSFSEAGQVTFPRISDDQVMMAELFAEAGFYTAGVIANSWLKGDHGFGQGFAEYTELESRDGREINELAKDVLRQQRDRKTFMYLHYMDVHNPYEGPSRGSLPFERPSAGELHYDNGPMPGLSDADLEFTMALYDERIFYMDGHVAELIEFLREEGLAEETTIVITSDHGDEFMEHGGLGHGTSLYSELVNSFAVLWGPGRFSARRIEACSQGIDLLPTLLTAYAIPTPSGLRGRSLFDRGAPPRECEIDIMTELATRKALISDGWKLVRDLSTGTDELFEVGVEGRIERENQLETALLGTDLRRKMDAFVSTLSTRQGEAVELDDETRKQLESLGYLGGK